MTESTLEKSGDIFAYPNGVGIQCKHHDRLFSPSELTLSAVLYVTPSL